ncbi:hypothetical protein [Streptomyces sp. NBC_01439]|uniref:hypothetical protein n=1 Tax=Streptomyces sp. NBC_01439 TaxID=2903867 RepID=UPI002E2CD0B6|nr:hypothetical protein [Streptomyces sp. NBC_01439]
MNPIGLVVDAVILIAAVGFVVGCHIQEQVAEKRKIRRRDPWRMSIETRARMRQRKHDTMRRMIQAAQQRRR